MLKSILTRLLQFTPYEIRRKPLRGSAGKADSPLVPTFNPVSLALEYFEASGSCNTLLQVGACDGGLGDPISCFLARGKIRAVLVEPIASNFNRLRARYKESDTITLLRVAVSHVDGIATMYRAKEDGRWSGNNWVGQVASFSKQHLLSHGVDETEIVEEQVPAMTVRSIIEHAGIEDVGFVQIDTEGFDAEVVTMVLELRNKPDFINFEHKHVPKERLASLYTQLTGAGYVWVQSEYDTLAVTSQLVEKWRPF